MPRPSRASRPGPPSRGRLRVWLVRAVAGAATLLVGFGAWRHFVASLPPRLGPTVGTPPNILVITLCSVRADHLGPWGYASASTPSLDALALDGVVFENAWSTATFTLPAHAAMLTGLLPNHVGILNTENVLAPTFPTLPEILRAYGYRTLAYAPVASRASFRAGDGLERGFDHFFEGEVGVVQSQVVAELAGGASPWFALVHYKAAHRPYLGGARAADVDPRVREWNDRMVRPNQTVSPEDWFRDQLLADPALARHVVGLYDRAVRAADTHVGRLLDAIARAGELDDTVVMVVGDHGESLPPDGRVGHQGYVEPEVIQVPWIVRLPHRAEAGRRVEADVSTVDLLPTLLELADAVPPARLDGRSVVPLLRGEALPVRGAVAMGSSSAVPAGDGLLVALAREGTFYVRGSRAATGVLRRRTASGWEAVDDPQTASARSAELTEAVGISVPPQIVRPATPEEREKMRKGGYF